MQIDWDSLLKSHVQTKGNNNIYNNYTTWKVDGATPMYRFIMAPY